MKKRVFFIFLSLLIFIGLFPYRKHLHVFVTYRAVYVPPVEMKSNTGPLVLDLGGDGIKLYRLNTYGTYFDFDADGRANLTGWVEDDDGLLAIDVNNNGRIDNMTELFGSHKTNGFKDLARHHMPFNIFLNDGIIDKNDAIFSKLRVWRDKNSDGFSQPEELKKLSDFDIVSISTKAKDLENTEISGNEILQEGTYKRTDGSERAIVTTWFDISPFYTTSVKPYVHDKRTDLLPTLTGFGTLEALHIAESEDNDEKDAENLLMLNSRLANNLNLEDLLQNWKKTEHDVEKILFRWAKVHEVSPKSRGPNIDARRLEFYEAYRGEKFRQTGYFEKHFDINYFGLKDPMPYAAKFTNAIYDYLLTVYTVHLSMQKLGKEIFVDPKYNIYSGSFRGNLKIKPEGIERIKTIARDAKDSDEVWMRVVQVIAYTKGFRGLGFLEMTRLNQAIKETSDTLGGLLDAVTQTEKKYGKIILSPEGWSSYDKSKAWRDDKKKAVEN